LAEITKEEREGFHDLLDVSIIKLLSEKNIKKVHWSKLELNLLRKMLKVEVFELDVAFECNNEEAACSECDDIINFAMFIKDNIKKGMKINQ